MTDAVELTEIGRQLKRIADALEKGNRDREKEANARRAGEAFHIPDDEGVPAAPTEIVATRRRGSGWIEIGIDGDPIEPMNHDDL